MEKVLNMYAPIRTEVSPEGGEIDVGTVVTIDTNIPATVAYTLDGSEPHLGAFGTFRADAPVEIELKVPARVRFKAFDSRVGQATNTTKTQEATFSMARTNAAEAFRDTAHFFRRLNALIVDENFYLTEGRWLLPVAGRPFTYVFVNREAFPVQLRVLHNGVDVFNNFPIVGVNQAKEVPIRPVSGENTIEVQTHRGGSTALYDIGRYDIDTYA
jgi:hypothetical protein